VRLDVAAPGLGDLEGVHLLVVVVRDAHGLVRRARLTEVPGVSFLEDPASGSSKSWKNA
jgi:hypothetical protein